MTFRQITVLIGIIVFGIVLTLPRLWGQIFPDRTWNPNSPYYRAELLQQSRRSRQLRDTAVFIGDSEIVGLAVSNFGPRSENFGIGGDTIDGLITRIPSYDWRGVSMIVIEIGINNWPIDRFAGIGDKYRHLLSLLPARVPIYAVSILPVNDHARGYFQIDGIHPAIETANAEIALACRQRPRCRFIDLAPRLADRSGNLRYDFDAGDGVHISPQGYAVWRGAIHT